MVGIGWLKWAHPTVDFGDDFGISCGILILKRNPTQDESP